MFCVHYTTKNELQRKMHTDKEFSNKNLHKKKTDLQIIANKAPL